MKFIGILIYALSCFIFLGITGEPVVTALFALGLRIKVTPLAEPPGYS